MSLSLGERLSRLREQRGVQQKEVAAQVGISPGRLSQLEKDQRRGRDVHPFRGTLERLAAYYEVLLDYLTAETPQEYMAAFVRARGVQASLITVGQRLRFVLEELQLRFGDDFGEDRVAEALGTAPETLQAYQADQILLSDQLVIDRLSEVTGVPTSFFIPRAAGAELNDPALRRAFDLALSNGMSAQEIELMIQTWLLARKTRRPSE